MMSRGVVDGMWHKDGSVAGAGMHAAVYAHLPIWLSMRYVT